jgi:hypothetical protein
MAPTAEGSSTVGNIRSDRIGVGGGGRGPGGGIDRLESGGAARVGVFRCGLGSSLTACAFWVGLASQGGLGLLAPGGVVRTR